MGFESDCHSLQFHGFSQAAHLSRSFAAVLMTAVGQNGIALGTHKTLEGFAQCSIDIARMLGHIHCSLFPNKAILRNKFCQIVYEAAMAGVEQSVRVVSRITAESTD
jgi:hypothetical protein